MIKLMEFHRSSNCAKVRIALNFKGIPFEMQEMSGADRSPMVKAANWPLVPVIVDGDVSMRDSEAILHYLEANYRDKPSLTPESADDIRKGETIVREAQRALGPALRKVFGQALKAPEERDPRALDGIVEEIAKAAEPLEKELAGKRFLLGERMTMYDILTAAPLMITLPRPDYAAQSPMWKFFGEHLSFPARLTNVRGWVDRVLAYDREPAGARA
jgi:glutathione S-transferase